MANGNDNESITEGILNLLWPGRDEEIVSEETTVPAYEPGPYTEVKLPDSSKIGGIFGAVFDEISTFFLAGFNSVWSGFLNLVPLALQSMINEFIQIASIGEDAAWEWFFRVLNDASILDRGTIENMFAFKGLPFPINSIVNVMIISMVLGEYMKTAGHAVSAHGRHELFKRLSPEIPYYNDLVQAAFVAPEITGEVRNTMRKGGLSEDDIDKVFLAAYRLYDESTIATLWLRGVLTDEQMYMRMRELGYTDTRIKEVMQSWSVIPGPQDLFTMVGKEAFEPDAIELMGLADEFPEDQVPWLQKQGVSRDWALRYWYAHWEQPSIQMGYEMLHRGIIGEEELDMLYKTVEIPPFWRDKLTKIAYSPFTRVDVRRMHKLGVVTDAELLQSYMDLGYDRDKAQKMTDFTIAYNADEDKELSKTEILKGYSDRIVNYEDALTLLQQVGFTQARGEYLLGLEDYKFEKDYQDDVIKDIGDRYQNNLMTASEARKKLGELNLQSRQIEMLMSKWDIGKFEDRKIPSKADLEKLIKGKVISKDDYILEMQNLGYSQKYIGWFYKLVTGKDMVS